MSGSTHSHKVKKRTRAKKPRSTTKRISGSSIIIKTILALTVTIVIVATVLKVSEFLILSQKTEFPKLEISLSEVPLEQINLGAKETTYSNNVATFTIDGTIFSYDNVEIKGHGNATWAHPKKPYQIKLSEKASIFNLSPAKKWLLLANHVDPSYLRNGTAFYLERLLDISYALNGNFIEVYFDNSYNGLYYLTEKIEAKKSRINLNDEYGIIVEFDNVYGKSKGCYYDISENCLTIKDAHSPDNQELAMKSFIDSFNAMQIAIKKQDYETIKNLIDIDSFVKYYLLNEFTVNPDAYSTSFHLYKNGKDDKIHAGPGWDFDIALGNIDWTPESLSGSSFHSPLETNPLKTFIIDNSDQEGLTNIPISTLFYDLINIPEFSERVKEIYQQTLSGKKDKLLGYIKSQADYIRPAALRDQARWKIKTDFDDEVDYLIDWVAKRYDHFEEIYGASSNKSNSEVTKSNEADSSPDLIPESPQPSSE